MVQAEDSAPKQINSIEGITEFRLANGTQVLLFPDESKSKVTVNMTVFVGSRHEGYGEAGMAHLLEHMLFKGTPSHEEIPQELKNRGAEFNGTTWLDRTNYYETLPATNAEQATENLEFAIRLEADRLMNSHVRGEDLVSEMTVVRNEFESGENSPTRVLMQRMHAAAYEWHNYGRSTIGNKSDIERVPIDRLRGFYRKFYRPDNVMVVVAGKFDSDTALELLQKYFGILEAPNTPLDRTYTTEPPQDGERTVVLRRVGNTQFVAATYHVPSAANREFAAVEMLAYIFGTEPTGRLYTDLVKPEVASGVFSLAFALHDPGLVFFGAQVPSSKSIESARQTLLQTVEEVGQEPITADELRRAQTQFLKARELRAANTAQLAIELSEWAAQGDWRLYFLFRDYIEQLSPEECTAVAKSLLTRNNRTVGLFIPSETSERTEMPSKPNLEELLAGYKGREAIQQGEEFNPDPLVVESRTTRGTLSNGIETAFLPKRTRGGSVNIVINLRYGNEESLGKYISAIEFLPEMLMRGTKDRSYQQLQDRFDELRSRVHVSGTTGLITVSIESKRKYLEELLPLISDMLRNPRLDPAELDILLRQAIAGTEAQMTEPQVLAQLAVKRALAPYDKDNIRYEPTLEESIERFRSVTVEDLAELHSTQVGATNIEITAVGDFDPKSLAETAETLFSGWESPAPFARIPSPANATVKGRIEEIQTNDKPNAVYYAGEQIRMRDDHPDYPALLIGNHILGGSGGLASRLGERVRQKEGLSYGVGSGINGHPVDERTSLFFFAITNPNNRDRVVQVIREEIDLLLEKGVTADELDAAKGDLLQSWQLDRTSDSNLSTQLASTIFAKRDMNYYANFEQAITDTDVESVNSALRQYFQPDRLVIVTAGDFAKVPVEN